MLESLLCGLCNAWFEFLNYQKKKQHDSHKYKDEINQSSQWQRNFISIEDRFCQTAKVLAAALVLPENSPYPKAPVVQMPYKIGYLVVESEAPKNLRPPLFFFSRRRRDETCGADRVVVPVDRFSVLFCVLCWLLFYLRGKLGFNGH